MSRLFLLVGTRFAFEDYIEKEIERLEFLKQRILIYRGNGHVIMNGIRLRCITDVDSMRGFKPEKILFLPGAEQLPDFQAILSRSKTHHQKEISCPQL